MLLETPQSLSPYSIRLNYCTLASYKTRFFRIIRSRSGVVFSKDYRIVTTKDVNVDYKYEIASSFAKEDIFEDWNLVLQYLNPVLGL